MILVYIPERVLQSFSLIPFDRSHLKKSSSDMVLLNFKFPFSSSADTFTTAHHNEISVKLANSTATCYFHLLDTISLHASMASEAFPHDNKASMNT